VVFQRVGLLKASNIGDASNFPGVKQELLALNPRTVVLSLPVPRPSVDRCTATGRLGDIPPVEQLARLVEKMGFGAALTALISSGISLYR